MRVSLIALKIFFLTGEAAFLAIAREGGAPAGAPTFLSDQFAVLTFVLLFAFTKYFSENLLTDA